MGSRHNGLGFALADRFTMIATEPLTTNCTSGTAVWHRARLRLLTAEGSGQDFALKPGRTTIGSSSRCTLRLKEPGVEPLHCVLVNDSDGLIARPWAPGTLLNGQPFEETRLATGDVLSVGAIDFQIIDGRDDRAQATHDVTPSVPDNAEERECPFALGRDDVAADCRGDSCDDVLTSLPEPPGTSGDKMAWAATAAEVFHQLQSANEVARGRSRKLLTALRGNRDGVQALAARVDELEQALCDALSEREFAVSGLRRPHERAAEYEASLQRLDELPNAEFRVPTIDEWNGIVEANARLDDEVEQLIDAQRRIVDEVVAISQNVTDLENRFESTKRDLTRWHNDLTEYREELGAWKSQLGQAAQCDAEPPCDLAATGEEAVPEPQEVCRKTVPILHLSRELQEAITDDEANFQAVENATNAIDEIGEESATLKGRYSSVEEIAENARPTCDESHGAELETYLPVAEMVDAPAQTPMAVVGELSTDAPTATGQEEADAHLHDSSIWKQDEGEPAVDSSVGAQAELPCVELAGDGSGSQDSPASFIERYARMFDGDEAAVEMSRAGDSSLVLEIIESRSQSLDFADARPLADEKVKQTADDKEETIEAYMAKLLKRIRGESAGAISTVASQHGAVSACDTSSRSDQRADGCHDEASNTENAPDSDRAPLRDVQEMKRREPVPEHATDLEALRALANESTRRAIGLHESRTHRHAALTKVIVALLAGMTSLLLMLQAPGWSDPQFIVACVSLMMAAYWAGQSYGAVVQSIRAGSYDGPERRRSDQPLPIDVERRR